MKTMRKTSTLSIGLAISLIAIGCSQEAPTAPDSVILMSHGFPEGPLRDILLGIDQIEIVFTESPSVEPERMTIDETDRILSLLDMQGGVLAALGISGLPVGFVTQLRLVLTVAKIALNGTLEDITVPSGVLKFAGEFQVFPDGSTEPKDLVFTFDLDGFVKRTGNGNFLLKTVIKTDPLPSFVYTVTQANVSQAVTPLVGTKNVIDFYDYNTVPVSSNTGLEKSNTSLLFLYEDLRGRVSLVMIHDKPFDGSGGKVAFAFSGVPVGTFFVVRDDPLVTEASLPTSTWRWNDCCTDGGALSGSLNQAFTITIGPDFPISGGLSEGKIDNWEHLTGSLNNPTAIPLDLTKPVTIEARRAG